MTVVMVTHDIKRGLHARHAPARLRPASAHDPQAPGRYGATITYDLDLDRDDAVPVLGFAKPRRRRGATPTEEQPHDDRPAATRLTGTPAPSRPRRASAATTPTSTPRETQGWKAIEAEGKLSGDGWRREQQWALDMGLPGAESLTDKIDPDLRARRAAAFRRHQHVPQGALCRERPRRRPNTTPPCIGIPFDSGTTYRPGTRFGPQGIRRISALYTPYNYELGVDLREQMTLCDAGDVFTIPANLEKSFDQITRGVAHVFSSGALPMMLGGDHSIGFPCVRGIAQCTSKRIGIIHFDRHIDIQEKDLDERMHTTPWYWATNLPNVSADQPRAARHRRLAGAARRRRRRRASAAPTC